MKYLKMFEDFSEDCLEYDVDYYGEYITLTRSEISQIRKEWMKIRRDAMNKLKKELNNPNIFDLDVSDSELFPYVDSENLDIFKKYSRMLDFDYGFKPYKNK